MKRLDLSIVILNYNTKEDLKSCLTSISKAHPRLVYEVIVVDNASTDGSSEMVKRSFPQVNLISSKRNLFFNGGFNLGLKRSRGKYVLMLEPDTVVTAKTLSSMKRFMDTHPRCGIASCRQTDLAGHTIAAAHRFPDPLVTLYELPILNRIFNNTQLMREYRYSGWDRSDIREIDAAPGAFMFCRRSVIQRLGFFDENFLLYYSDDDLSRRVKMAGWQVFHVGTVSIVHTGAQSTQKLPLPYIMNIANRDVAYYHRKYSGLFWAVIVALATRLHLILFTGIFLLKYAKFTVSRAYIQFVSFRDYNKLRKLFPQLFYLQKLSSSTALLAGSHRDYITTVSRDDMAISLEMAAFLLAICEATKPTTVADLGSGYSSLVFRTYSTNTKHPISVISVDDNEKWLAQTARFLKKNKLPTDRLMTWSDFSKLHKTFDLVFHDLGHMETRADVLPRVLQLVKPGGFLVLDDLHFPVYRQKVLQSLIPNSSKLLLLRRMTKDRFGRYGALWIK